MMKLALLAVLLAPTAALQGCPVVLRSHCSSRALPVSALDRSAQPSTPPPMIPLAPTSASVRHSPRNVLQRVLGGLRTAALVGAAGVLMRVPGASTALAAAKAPPKPVATKPAPNTALTSFLTTAAMGGGLVYWSIRVASEEDREEQERIKTESEKEKSMAKEYTDIDGGVTMDEDLMASLRSRLGNSTEASGGEESGGSAPEEPPTPPPAPLGGGSSAVLDGPPPAPEAEEPPTASPEDIERLKRMFGGLDADK